MRKIVLLIAGLVALSFLSPDFALAKLVKVSWISESDLKSKCEDNKGKWSSGATGYNCSKKCGNNDTCVYGCSKGKEHNECNGSVPAMTGGTLTVDNVLNGGVKAVGAKSSGQANPLSPGLLDGSKGFSPQAPAGMGTVPAPSAPSGGPVLQ